MNRERKKGGRHPKLEKKTHHVMLRFNDEEWLRFLAMYEQTEVKAKAVFAKARIFGGEFRVFRWTGRWWNTTPSCLHSMRSTA